MHTCTYIYIHAHIHAYMHTCMHACISGLTHAHIFRRSKDSMV